MVTPASEPSWSLELRAALLQVFPQPALPHHLVQEVLHDHEQEQHLALLTLGHTGQHLQQFGVDFLGQRQTVRDFRHL